MRQAPAAQDGYWDEDYDRPQAHTPSPRRDRAPPPIPRDEYFERETRPRAKRPKGFMEGIFAFVKQRPTDGIAIALASVFCVAILFNMLVLQKKPVSIEDAKLKLPEPATIAVSQTKIPEPSLLDSNSFSVAKPRANPVEEVQRELARRNIYQDTVDGRMGSKTQQAIREFQRQNGLKVTGEITEDLLFTLRPSANIARPSNIAAPPKHSTLTDLVEQVQEKPEVRKPEPANRNDGIKRMVAVQKALNQMAFGPIVTNGVMSAETRSAILRFEADRKLTPKGEVTEKLVKQLEAVLGTRIE